MKGDPKYGSRRHIPLLFKMDVMEHRGSITFYSKVPLDRRQIRGRHRRLKRDKKKNSLIWELHMHVLQRIVEELDRKYTEQFLYGEAEGSTVKGIGI